MWVPCRASLCPVHQWLSDSGETFKFYAADSRAWMQEVTLTGNQDAGLQTLSPGTARPRTRALPLRFSSLQDAGLCSQQPCLPVLTGNRENGKLMPASARACAPIRVLCASEPPAQAPEPGSRAGGGHTQATRVGETGKRFPSEGWGLLSPGREVRAHCPLPGKDSRKERTKRALFV